MQKDCTKIRDKILSVEDRPQDKGDERDAVIEGNGIPQNGRIDPSRASEEDRGGENFHRSDEGVEGGIVCGRPHKPRGIGGHEALIEIGSGSSIRHEQDDGIVEKNEGEHADKVQPELPTVPMTKLCPLPEYGEQGGHEKKFMTGIKADKFPDDVRREDIFPKEPKRDDEGDRPRDRSHIGDELPRTSAFSEVEEGRKEDEEGTDVVGRVVEMKPPGEDMRIDDVLEKVLKDVEGHEEDDDVALCHFRSMAEWEIDRKDKPRRDEQDQDMGSGKNLKDHPVFLRK